MMSPISRIWSQPPAATTTTFALLSTTTDKDDADARLCVICTESIVVSATRSPSSWSRADPYWIEMHCGGVHSHLYHADCLALWWFERDHRNCPRCTQAGQDFSVHARSPHNGEVLTRKFSGGTTTSDKQRGTMMQRMVLRAQTMEFTRRARFPFPKERGQPGWEGLGEQMDVWHALVAWPREMWRDVEGDVAKAGLDGAREVETAWERYWAKREEKRLSELEREQMWRTYEGMEEEARHRLLNRMLNEGEQRARETEEMLARLWHLMLRPDEGEEVAGVNVGWGVLPGEDDDDDDEADAVDEAAWGYFRRRREIEE